MKIDDDKLKEIFQGYASSRRPLTRKGCPSPKAIARSFEPSASVRKKKRIVDHVSGCSSCHDEFMMFLEIQRREPASDRLKSRPPLWRYASVLLGLGLVVTSVFVAVHQKELADIQRAAEAGIILLHPKADQSLSGPPVFRWQARSAADFYVLELFDDALLPIWTSDKVRDLQVPLPPQVTATLRPGKSYFWMVTAFSQGSKIEESHLGRFVIHR